MSQAQVKRIEKLLVDFATLSTVQQKQKRFKSVKLTVSRVINNIERSQLQLQNRLKQQGKFDAATSNSKSYQYKQAKKMQLAKTDKSEKDLRDKLKQDLVTGYEVLMTIRKALTEQSIQYNFLVQTGKNSFSSIQTELSYQQLINMVSLQAVSKGDYQLRFKNLISFINNSQNVITYQYEDFVENNPSSAFSTFYRFFTDKRFDNDYKLGNLGTFFEAYHYWYYKHGNDEIPSNEQVLDSFRYAKSGGGQGGAFYRGGDVGNISDKAQSLSQKGNPGRPSLTYLNAIRNGLIEVKNEIERFINDQNGTEKQIRNIFKVSRIGQTVENGVFETAREVLYNEIPSVIKIG